MIILCYVQLTSNKDLCEVEITATTANGYSSNMSFALSLYAEDHSRDPVKLTNSHTVITTGPFSRVPIKVCTIWQTGKPVNECFNPLAFTYIKSSIGLIKYS